VRAAERWRVAALQHERSGGTKARQSNTPPPPAFLVPPFFFPPFFFFPIPMREGNAASTQRSSLTYWASWATCNAVSELSEGSQQASREFQGFFFYVCINTW
jgi:hypothetical protein